MPRKYPLNYREAEINPLIAALDGGHSVSVVGPPGVGKSNVLQYLDQKHLFDRPEHSPWLRYAPKHETLGHLVAVPIDPNALLPALPLDQGEDAARAWPGFELLIHRMVRSERLAPQYLINPMQDDLKKRVDQMRERFQDIHPQLTDFGDALHGHMALRQFERMIEITLDSFALQDQQIRIVIILDEFERLLDTMPDYFFVALRSVRDRFKSRLMFVTFARDSLMHLVQEQDRRFDLEPFIELFNDNQIYLKPFVDSDAWDLVRNLESRSNRRSDYPLQLLIRAAGGFASLLRAGFPHAGLLESIPDTDPHRIAHSATRLVAEKNVQIECETLLGGLRQVEIDALYGVAHHEGEHDPRVLRELVNKSLLREDSSGGVMVVPPVLATYINIHREPPRARPRARPFSMPK